MKMIPLGKTGVSVSQVALGCMRMANLTLSEAEYVIRNAMEQGVNFFDHADIYGKGESEQLFSNAIGKNSAIREKMILQSKCGICPGYFDFSKKHILESVDGILTRLQTDYLDVLLLHRPDCLMEPEEVADAFSVLKSSGKVRFFGVSNQSMMQIELLRKYWKEPLAANQLQFGIMHTGMIDFGLHVNMKDEASFNHDLGVLEYCRLHDITIQAWSPFQYGFFEGVFLDNDKFPKLNQIMADIAKKYGVSKAALAVAWISRHPAKIQTIVGTMNASRLTDICDSTKVSLSREDWYEIYRAAGNTLP